LERGGAAVAQGQAGGGQHGLPAGVGLEHLREAVVQAQAAVHLDDLHAGRPGAHLHGEARILQSRGAHRRLRHVLHPAHSERG